MGRATFEPAAGETPLTDTKGADPGNDRRCAAGALLDTRCPDRCYLNPSGAGVKSGPSAIKAALTELSKGSLGARDHRRPQPRIEQDEWVAGDLTKSGTEGVEGVGVGRLRLLNVASMEGGHATR